MLPACACVNPARASARRADTTTRAPAACKAAAVASPMPLLAPISHTVLPRQSASGGFSGVKNKPMDAGP